MPHSRFSGEEIEQRGEENPDIPEEDEDGTAEWLEELDALIAQIDAAFDGVGRKGGTTMGEAYEESFYGTPEEKAEARLQDTDKLERTNNAVRHC